MREPSKHDNSFEPPVADDTGASWWPKAPKKEGEGEGETGKESGVEWAHAMKPDWDCSSVITSLPPMNSTLSASRCSLLAAC